MVNVNCLKITRIGQSAANLPVGLAYWRIVQEEGSETRSMSPNNNSIHENPALVYTDDDIVQPIWKHIEVRIKSLTITGIKNLVIMESMEQIQGAVLGNGRAVTRGTRV